MSVWGITAGQGFLVDGHQQLRADVLAPLACCMFFGSCVLGQTASGSSRKTKSKKTEMGDESLASCHGHYLDRRELDDVYSRCCRLAEAEKSYRWSPCRCSEEPCRLLMVMISAKTRMRDCEGSWHTKRRTQNRELSGSGDDREC